LFLIVEIADFDDSLGWLGIGPFDQLHHPAMPFKPEIRGNLCGSFLISFIETDGFWPSLFHGLLWMV